MKTVEFGFRMMDQFPEEVQRDYLKKVLKGRRKTYFISINGWQVGFKRSTIRDYLQKKFGIKDKPDFIHGYVFYGRSGK